jgi:hypothetical protein
LTLRERERERERTPCHHAIPLSHLIIMAMFHTLQINVREEKAAPFPPKVDDNTIQKMMMSFTLCHLIHFFLHKRESLLAFFACKFLFKKILK